MLLSIQPGTSAFAQFVDALTVAGLPTEDLHAEPSSYFSLPSKDAFGGFQQEGADALLRSIVVSPTSRRSGRGRTIVEGLVDVLASEGVQRIWLLTTDASAFFTGLGWQRAARNEAPASIAATRQFSSLCPATAVLMCRHLT